MEPAELKLRPDYVKLSQYIGYLSDGFFNDRHDWLREVIENFDQRFYELVYQYGILNIISELCYLACDYFSRINGRHNPGELYNERVQSNKFFKQRDNLYQAVTDKKQLEQILFKFKGSNVSIDSKQLINLIRASVIKKLSPHEKHKIYRKVDTRTFSRIVLKTTKPIYCFIKDNSSLKKSDAIEFVVKFLTLLGHDWDANLTSQEKKEAFLARIYKD